MKLNNMTKERRRMLISISVFYAIAVAIRAAAMQINPPSTVGVMFLLRGWAEGLGPCIGALVAVIMFGRKFFWHLRFHLSLGSLLFLIILVLGSWGIGRIAKDTHSLMACACFHTLYNFSTHGFFQFTPAVICIYVVVVVSWFVVWYTPWARIFPLRRVE